jgi:hypothetical protein
VFKPLFKIENTKFMGYFPPILWLMGLLGHGREIWGGRPRSHKNQDFHFKNRDFPGFRMDVHPDVFNDGGSFPDADPPSEPEDDLVDKRTAAESYYNNHGNKMKKIIAMAVG